MNEVFKFEDMARSFTESFEEIAVCIAHDNSKNSYSAVVESFVKNMAEYMMNHLPMAGVTVFAIDERQDKYLLSALQQAQSLGKKYLLYVQVGNITEWPKKLWKSIVDQLYSSDYKFIGHILEADNGSYYIHPQFFIMDVDWGIKNNVSAVDYADDRTWIGHVIERSEESFHDGYTPIWVKGTDKVREYTRRYTGWSIIEKLAETKVEFAPWNMDVRNNKLFCYYYVNEMEALKDLGSCVTYINERRTYIANTEEVKDFVNLKNIKQFVTPASGESTFLYSYMLGVNKIIVYDRIDLSLSVFRDIFNNWDGIDYKNFVSNRYNVNDKSLFLASEYLDSANKKIEDLGDDFLNWWRKKEYTTIFSATDIFDHSTWNKMFRYLDDVPTIINLSNILHFHTSAMLYTTEEKYKFLQMFKERLYRHISPENIFFHGSNPLYNTDLDGKFDLNKCDFTKLNNMPWRK
jgi:hypothetical protein